jgi:hypothetical protein
MLMKRRFSSVPPEMYLWGVALLFLALIDPGSSSHFILCPLKALGVTFCPGCGIGHSISWLLHGDTARSFAAHPFGAFAVMVILYRIGTLLRFSFRNSQSIPTVQH